MTIPTADELRAAQEAIVKDGPVADQTMKLGMLALRDPTCAGIVKRMADSFAGQGVSNVAAHSFAMGAFIAGLNLGLRVGEGRR